MKEWLVDYTYTMAGTSRVEADTEDEAKEIVKQQFLSGLIGNGDDECQTGKYKVYKPVLDEDEAWEE